MTLAIDYTQSEAERLLAIGSRPELADLLRIPDHQLKWLLYRTNAEDHYQRFRIPKRAGGSRTIHAPLGGLKILQKRLNNILRKLYVPPRYVTGFVNGRSVLDNARIHSRQRWVFTIDLEDFFPSINFGRVRGLLMTPPYAIDPSVATVVSKLCTFENMLPQGAPTSPIISNMICVSLDRKLTRLASNNRARYSRYADDITFSTNRAMFAASIVEVDDGINGGTPTPGEGLTVTIDENGFAINHKKTRLRSMHHTQIVTGLVVNSQPNVRRRFRREIRAMLHAWERYGLQTVRDNYSRDSCRPDFMPEKDFRAVLMGKLAYLKMIRGEGDRVYQRYMSRFRYLDAAHRDVNAPEDVDPIG